MQELKNKNDVNRDLRGSTGNFRIVIKKYSVFISPSLLTTLNLLTKSSDKIFSNYIFQL